MTHQEASAVVTVPLVRVEKALSDVEAWPSFIGGVGQVTKTSHERYTFKIADGRSIRDVRVSVRHNHRDHCYTWRAVNGVRFEGCLRLRAVDGTRTRVSLSLTSRPTGFLANLSEMVAPNKTEAVLDLQRLESHLVSAGP
jgi:uncharacterized membrane protein